MTIHSGIDLFASHQERIQNLLDGVAARNKVNQDKVDQGKTETDAPFATLLREGIGQVNNMQLDSNALVEKLLAGEDVNQAEVFTSVQKADMSFRLLVQIRNKLMQAFEELNSIRV